MAKKLRDIAGKGQFAGVHKSTVAPPDIDDKNLYQWNAPDGVKFIKKHDTETHDYPYDAEAAFKGKKGGVEKTTKYKFQKDGVYEELELEEGDLTIRTLYNKWAHHSTGDDAKGGAKAAAVEKAITKVHGPKVMGHLKSALKANLKGDFDGEKSHFEKARSAAGKSEMLGATVGSGRSEFRKTHEETELDEKYEGFKKTEKALAAKGAKNPSALAAWIGRKKYGKAKFQAAAAAGKKLGEEVSCNHSAKGVHCEMHGEDDCSFSSDKEPRYKGKKLLTDKKKEVAEASQYRSTYGMGKKGWASEKAGKVTFQGPANFNRTGESKAKNREEAERLSVGKKVTKLPPGKAKLKEDIINEVAPPNPKIEKWIKSNKERFVKEYGKEKGMQVLYAKAWKMHGQSESGTSSPATNTDYAGPGDAGWSTGRHDVGTL